LLEEMWCRATELPLVIARFWHELPVGAAAAALNRQEEDDAGLQQLRKLEESNKYLCDFLTAHGFDCSRLRINAPTRSVVAAVTEANSKERVLAIKAAKTAGQLFHATGGNHLNSDDFFRAKALAERDQAIKEMEQRKKTSVNALALQRSLFSSRKLSLIKMMVNVASCKVK
jgi:hypothetical protein